MTNTAYFLIQIGVEKGEGGWSHMFVLITTKKKQPTKKPKTTNQTNVHM